MDRLPRELFFMCPKKNVTLIRESARRDRDKHTSLTPSLQTGPQSLRSCFLPPTLEAVR